MSEKTPCVKDIADTVKGRIVEYEDLTIIGNAIFCDNSGCGVCYNSAENIQYGECAQQVARLAALQENKTRLAIGASPSGSAVIEALRRRIQGTKT